MFKIYQGIDPKTDKRRETTRRGFSTYREAEMEYDKLKMTQKSLKFHETF